MAPDSLERIALSVRYRPMSTLNPALRSALRQDDREFQQGGASLLGACHRGAEVVPVRLLARRPGRDPPENVMGWWKTEVAKPPQEFLARTR